MPLNPWLKIWTKPRTVIREILAFDPEYKVLLLAAMGGIGQALDRASRREMGDEFPLLVILGLSILLGPIGGIITMYISSALVHVTGQSMGGQAKKSEIRTAYAWANVPLIFALLLWACQIGLLGNKVFTSDTVWMEGSLGLSITYIILLFVELILSIWAFVIFVRCLAEIQEFTIWKALGNIVTAFLLFVVPILFVVGIIVILF